MHAVVEVAKARPIAVQTPKETAIVLSGRGMKRPDREGAGSKILLGSLTRTPSLANSSL